jgi:hypothetical protein
VFSSCPFATGNYVCLCGERERMPLGVRAQSAHNESALVGGVVA